MKKVILPIVLLIFIFFSGVKVFSQPFKVMTYNIRLALASDKENRWENRKASMVELIKHYQPEIFGIQEGLYRQVHYLDSSLTSYHYTGVGRDDGRTEGEYSAIFYDTTKFKLLDHGTFWLSEHPEKVSMGWDAAYIRICSWGLFEDIQNGKKFRMFNTHFDNEGVVARKEAARLILHKIDSLNQNHLPVILTGDLNSVPDSEPVKILKSKLTDALSISIQTPYGPTGTFTGFNPDKVIDNRIDYIFVDGFNVMSYTHIDDRRKDNYFVSDHLPVMAELGFVR